MINKSVLTGFAVFATVLGTSGGVVLADTTLPVATNAANPSVSGQSDATVKVVDGFLSLDAVPDMNFGLVANAATTNKDVPLINNQGLISDDGNDAGLLKVTDSRTASEGTGKTWQLTAGVGKFTNINGNAVSNPSYWAINLKQTSVENSLGKMPILYQPKIVSDGDAQSVMQSGVGGVNGSTSVYYNKANTVSLDMGANVAPGQYDAPITWTLSANPDASVNH